MTTLPWYIRYAIRRPPTETILDSENGRPYLRRWAILPKNPIFNIYLHHFVGSDKRMVHDHPWISLSKMLTGSVREVYYVNSRGKTYVRSRVVKEGEWTYRSSRFLHYVLQNNKTGERTPPVWTLFFTGPRIRTWGFETPSGWKPYFQVLKGAHKTKGY